MQHWSLAEYHLWKRELVVEALAQAGVIAPVGRLIDAHGQGRRRATLHARRGAKDILEVGFTAPRAHHIVAIDRCPILAPGLDGAIPAAWAIAEILKPTNKPLDIQMTATDSGMDVDVRGSGPLSSGRTTALAGVAEKHKLARITRHGELVAQAAQPLLKVGRANVPLPPGAFLQATAEGEATLARLVLDHVGDAKRIADLFCGIGTFALRLAERARVTAADSDAAAIKALQQAAAKTSGLKPVDAQARDLFRRPFMAAELKGFDAVVFDPPRQGAEAQARELVKERRAGRGRGVMRRGDLRARCAYSDRWRLQTRRRHAGRSVPLFVPRRDGGEVREIATDKASRATPGWPHIFAISSLLCSISPACAAPASNAAP